MKRRPGSRVLVRPEVVWNHLHRRHLAQREFAKLVDMNPGYLSQVLSGKRSPSARRRRRLQEELGIDDFDELFYVEPDDDG
ncbi:MAG: helix-turn-helix transcriptional regulator [Chloroflexi bacterium]|nr:helix-turn-helix transcriptional regulator [Chloroflexota bacterium]